MLALAVGSRDFHSVGVCFYGCSGVSSDFGARRSRDLGGTLSERSNKEKKKKQSRQCAKTRPSPLRASENAGICSQRQT